MNRSPNVMAMISGWSRHGVPSWWMISQSSSTSFRMCAVALRPRMSVKEPASGLRSIKFVSFMKKRSLHHSDFISRNFNYTLAIMIEQTHLPYSSFENFRFSMFKPDVNGFLLCLSLCLFAYWSNIATLSLNDSWNIQFKR